MGQCKVGRLIVRAMACCAVIAVMLTMPSLYPTHVSADTLSDKREELADLQKEWKELEQSIKNLGDDIEDQKKKVAQLNRQVSNLEKQVEAYEEQVAAVDQTLAEQTARIDALDAEIALKEQEMEAIMDQLKKRVKAITQTGNYSSFQMLFNTENYTDFLLKSQVLKCISDHDKALQEKAEAEKQALANACAALEAEKAAVEVSKAELLALKAELDAQMATLEKLYVTAYAEQEALEKKLGTYEQRQDKIEKAEEELEKEIQQLVNGSTTATYGGKMFWPVPAVKQVSCTYGQKKTYFHGGTDIWGPGILKKPIYAAADGEVVKAVKMHYSYGNYVMVDHGLDENGVRIMTLYAHMYSTPSVNVGDKVIGGKTQLGLVGSTGNSTGPHLHFEVREDGKRVNPEKGYIVRPK